MMLSPNFTLAELTHTDTGLPNTPSEGDAFTNLHSTARHMEDVRSLLGHPIIVNSGYRSPSVNQVVRGVPTSAHCLGYAVDFVCPDFGNPTEVAFAIANSAIQFDQLIREYGWVHISFDPRMRGDRLTKTAATAPYKQGIA